jgi:homoserine O-acetyltransferase
MPSMHRIATLFAALLFCVALPAFAANYPDPKESSWVAKDFRFHTGEVMPEVTLH